MRSFQNCPALNYAAYRVGSQPNFTNACITDAAAAAVWRRHQLDDVTRWRNWHVGSDVTTFTATATTINVNN